MCLWENGGQGRFYCAVCADRNLFGKRLSRIGKLEVEWGVFFPLTTRNGNYLDEAPARLG